MEKDKMKLEIIIWEDKTWAEIPQEDNPAFDFVYEDNRLQQGFKGVRNECLLVMKALPYEAKSVGVNGYTVIHVPIKGDVIRRGLFWSLDDAIKFANSII